MLFLILKLAVFGLGWLIGRAAIGAAGRARALDGVRARLIMRGALGLVIALYWYPELGWAVAHPGAVVRALGVLGLTALPVAGFVLFLRWAHRRARRHEGER
ncbi:MAG: hypothetical protein RQ752_09765 [Thermohalobaculum sp.]|nr:hypothetical protein [Thermohalobaculum sp.]